jgi:hypothetical protein
VSHTVLISKYADSLSVGRVPQGAKVTPIFDFDVLESIEIGDVISPLGDYLMVWDGVSIFSGRQ